MLISVWIIIKQRYMIRQRVDNLKQYYQNECCAIDDSCVVDRTSRCWRELCFLPTVRCHMSHSTRDHSVVARKIPGRVLSRKVCAISHILLCQIATIRSSQQNRVIFKHRDFIQYLPYIAIFLYRFPLLIYLL